MITTERSLTELVEHATERELPSDTDLVVCYMAPHWTATDYVRCTRDTIAGILEQFQSDMYRYTDTIEAIVYDASAIIELDNGEIMGADGYPLCLINTNEDSDYGWTIEGA